MKRVEGGAQPAGGLAVRHLDARVLDRAGDHHEGRHLVPRAEPLRRHRADVRVLLVGPAKPSGLEQLLAGLVDRRGVVVDRSDERQPVHPGGQPREMLADPDAGNPGGDRPERPPDLGGSIGLGVPRLELAGPADEHQQDHRPITHAAAADPRAFDSASESPSEPSPTPPTRRKSRRVTPEHISRGTSAQRDHRGSLPSRF